MITSQLTYTAEVNWNMLTRVGFELTTLEYQSDSEIESKHWTAILMDSIKLLWEYLMHLNWIKVASNPCGLDSSTSRGVDRYPKGASSNPSRVNIFDLTLAM